MKTFKLISFSAILIIIGVFLSLNSKMNAEVTHERILRQFGIPGVENVRDENGFITNTVISSTEIPEDIINVCTINMLDEWDFSPEDPNSIFESVKDNGLVMKIKVLEVLQPEFIKPFKPSTEGELPYTPIKVKVIDKIFGTIPEDILTLYVFGGGMLASDYYKSFNEEGLNQLYIYKHFKNERQKYVVFTSDLDCDYDMEIDKEYVVITDLYYGKQVVQGNGYGIFCEDDFGVLTNVITGKTHDFQINH